MVRSAVPAACSRTVPRRSPWAVPAPIPAPPPSPAERWRWRPVAACPVPARSTWPVPGHWISAPAATRASVAWPA
ncbi:hypothetical protein G6F51_014668 [Rhizopus arrhizus]|uniref:Uncharacterized protein n=1 Tax=Rhizopus oryzae TaxID=64495 RepID=A0A9P6XLQ9_RHIOR|nr:hypothetical protein G6F51_014668 [Rhizopus arrhizus]